MLRIWTLTTVSQEVHLSMCRGIGLHLFFAQVYSRDIVIRYIYGMETYE